MTICQVLDKDRPEISGCQSLKIRPIYGDNRMSTDLAPGYTEALGARLAQAIDQGGGVLAVARALEVSKDTPARWRDGRSKISLHDLTRIAAIAGMDPIWLAFGAPVSTDGIDYDLVQEAAETVIEVTISLGQPIDPGVLARTIRERAERLARDLRNQGATPGTLTSQRQRG